MSSPSPVAWCQRPPTPSSASAAALPQLLSPIPMTPAQLLDPRCSPVACKLTPLASRPPAPAHACGISGSVCQRRCILEASRVCQPPGQRYTPFFAFVQLGTLSRACLSWSGSWKPYGGEVCGIQTERDTSNAACDPRDAHTLGAWACSSPNPVSGEIGLCLLLRPSVCACGRIWGIISASEPPPWPLVPIEARDAVPGDVTPARNEVAPPPGQPGPGFQQTECLAAVLAGQDSGRAGKLSQARLGIREQPGGPGSWFSLVRSWKERGGRSV